MTALQIGSRQITIKAFIAGIRKAKANPQMRFRDGFDWSDSDLTGKQIVHKYHKSIDENINRRAGISIPTSDTWMIRFSQMINGNFIVRPNDIPPKLRKRFANSRRIYRD